MDTSSLLEHTYQDLCSTLFAVWAKYVKKNKAYARKIRALLSAVHCSYRDDQACPYWYAEYILDLADRIRK